MNCEKNCVNKKACDILGECIYSHSLIKDVPIYIQRLELVEHLTMKGVLKFFESIKPPKVSDDEKNRHYHKSKCIQYGIKKVKKKKVKVPKKKSDIVNPHFSEGKLKEKIKRDLIRTETQFILYNKNKCLLYGYLNKRIGYGLEIGAPVYYDIFDDKFVMQYAGTLIAYYANTVKDFIVRKQSELVKDVIIKTEQETQTARFSIEDWQKEAEPNFHY